MPEQIFEESVGLILDIRLWSGAKKLKDEDFQGIELPPEDLVSLGSKRIHNKEALKPIQAVRTKAVSYLESVAVSLYGGKVWIIPNSMLEEVQSTMEELAVSFEHEKARFLRNFNDEQRQWINRNSQWARILEPYLDAPEAVEKRFGFSWRVFKMSSVQEDGLADTVSGDMTCALLKEVSALAAEAYETLKDKDRATQKNLNRLDRLASKLRGLSFVDPGVTVIEQELTQILNGRDVNGVLSGQDVFHLARLLVQLKEPRVLREVLDAAHAGAQYRFDYSAGQTREEQEPPSPAARPHSRNIHQPRLPDAWF
jgi:hypothetical protein